MGKQKSKKQQHKQKRTITLLEKQKERKEPYKSISKKEYPLIRLYQRLVPANWYHISALPDKDREHILYTIDGLIKSAKLQAL